MPKPVLQLTPLARTVSALLLVAVLGSCGDGRRPAAPSGPAGPAAPTLSPKPAPNGERYGAPARLVQPALLGDADLAFLPAPLAQSMDTAGSEDMSPCGRSDAEKDWGGPGYLRQWRAGTSAVPEVVVAQYVQPFWRNGLVVSAADVVAQIRQRTTCRTYQSREGTPRLSGEVTLPPLPGAPAGYAFCERVERTGGAAYGACTGYLAQGFLVSKVRVRALDDTAARERFEAVMKVAAARLPAG